MNKFDEKLKQNETNLIEASHDEHLEKIETEKRNDAFFILGGIKVAEQIAQSISAKVIQSLIYIQNEDLHQQFGYARFADFLNNDEKSPMSKSEFYRRKELYEKEGSDLFDKFNELNIANSHRKQLKPGDVSFDGDKIIIGDQEANLADQPAVKNLIKEFVLENRQLEEKKEKQQSSIEHLEKALETGRKEYEELRRNFDGEGDEFQQAFSKAMVSMVALKQAAKNLTLVEKEERGEPVVQGLWTQMLNVRHELNQNDFPLHDMSNNTVDIDPKIAKVLADSGDWD